MTSAVAVLTDPFEAVDKLLEVRKNLQAIECSTLPGTAIGDPVAVALDNVELALEGVRKLADQRQWQHRLNVAELAKRERS